MLGDIKSKKVRHMSDYAYVTFETPEDAQKAIPLIDGHEIKKFILSAKLAEREVKDLRPAKTENTEPTVLKTARESVTPLAEMSYEQQLELKQNNSAKWESDCHIKQCYFSISESWTSCILNWNTITSPESVSKQSSESDCSQFCRLRRQKDIETSASSRLAMT